MLTTGTYEWTYSYRFCTTEGRRISESASYGITERLRDYGFRTGRLKTELQ